MSSASRKPQLFISASAVGYYGDCGIDNVEESHSAGSDFLAQICLGWEHAALEANAASITAALPRIGIVLHPSGGALERMLLPFRLYVGGALGSGKQYFPWVHFDDTVRGILFPLRQMQQGIVPLQGAYNLASPHPVTMHEFAKTLGKVLHRPSLFPVPALALRMVLGESAQYLLQGQKIKPTRLINAGFEFHFPLLASALHHLLG